MRRRPISRWEKTNTIATLAQTILVGGSLIFINLQMNQQVNLSRSANAQAFVGLGQPLNLALTENDLAKIWVKQRKQALNEGEPAEAEIETEQFKSMLASYLVFYENIYIQYELDLVKKEFFDLWDEDLENFVKETPVEKHWKKSRCAYQQKFRDRVDGILSRKPQLTPSPLPSQEVVTPCAAK